MPEEGWPQPEGIVTARINPVTGARARAGEQGAVFEVFRKDQVPKEDRDGLSFKAGSGSGSDESLTQELF